MRKYNILLFFFFALFLSTFSRAQDLGEADTLRISSASVDITELTSVSLSVTLFNDREITGIVIPLEVDGYSGWMRFDSVSHLGGRLDDPNVLPERESVVFATDTFSYEQIVVSYSISSGLVLPAGDGKICDLWFTPLFGGPVSVGSCPESPYGPLSMIGPSQEEFTPEFQAGEVDISCNYLVGDTRHDGAVDVSDYMGFFKQYLGCGESKSPRYIADVNCDRHVDMRDSKALIDKNFFDGSIGECGDYNPALYNDPGIPDTVRINNETLYLGVVETINLHVINDEQIQAWSIGVEWDGSAILDLDDSFSYGPYLCATRHGNPGYICPYNMPNYERIPAGINIVMQIPFIPKSIGTATFQLRDFPDGPETMLVNESDEAVLPVFAGGIITVLPRPCGDANKDGPVDIGDAVYIINTVFKSGPVSDPECIADANGDEGTDVGDAVYLINCIFKGGPLPTESCCE